MTDSVVGLAARCAVALHSGNRFLGSGFFIAPGQVLTCAHVAAGCPEPLIVRWAGGDLTARTEQLIPPEAGTGRTYEAPDLALITVETQPDQPFAWLADRGPATGSDVLCLGFSEATTQGGVDADSVLVQAVAAGGGGLVKVQEGEIPEGMSGSLVLDLDSQRVCGLVKASRDPQAPRGGWIIPVPVVARHLGATVEQNMAGHGPTSPWRQLATRHEEFARRLFGSRSPLRVAEPPANVPPSWWLDPRHRSTGFQKRPELQSLLAWAFGEDPATPVARLVVGEGGSGKTRLAVELATRLAARGWIAGLLTADDLGRLPVIAEALHEILAYGHRVFIAIDYPEGLGDELTRFLARLPLPDEGTVRILLLARFGGGWWDALHPAGEIKYLIDREPVQLTPLGPDAGAAERRFGEALRDYRLKILGPDAALADASPGTAVPLALAEAVRQHSSAIKLHALALVSALHERDAGTLPSAEIAWADPLDSLVSHERRHWSEAARGRTLSSARDAGWSGRILLVPTLVAAYRGEEATAAISRIPGIAERFPGEAPETAGLLRDLYPPDESASLRWWSPLPLDRLGETLLASVLEELSESAGCEYLAVLFRAASLPETIQGLTVLVRLGADPATAGAVRERVSRFLDALAAADGSRLLPALLVVDRQFPPEGERPGERQLARLDLADTMTLVQHLRDASHRLLQETGLGLLDHAERILSSDEIPVASDLGFLREMSAELRDAGIDLPLAETPAHTIVRAMRAELLMRLGRAGEAIAPAEAAARQMRAIFRAGSAPGLLNDGDVMVFASEPSDYSTELLKVLDIYARALGVVGRLEESAKVRRECADVARQAARRGDPASRRAMVRHLCELAEALLARGEAAEAEQSARDAAEYARSLPDVAAQGVALAIWARALDQAGRPAEARRNAADAVRLFRQAANSAEDRVPMARAIQGLGDLAPTDTAGFDVLTELRAAASRDPASAVPAFVYAAIKRADDLAGQDDTTAARRQLSEALAQARRLAADDPDTHLPVVAYVLINSAQLESAASLAAEAAGIYRRLVDERGRDDLRPDLALAVMQHSLLLRDAGRDTEALPGFAEAIEMLRPLLAQDRWRNTPYLCSALALFAETARKHGNAEEAVAAAREAIDLEITRTDDAPPAPAEHLPDLRHILFLALARLLSVRGEQRAAAPVVASLATEVCGIARDLPAGMLTEGDRTIVASALRIQGAIATDSGRPEDAVTLLGDAIAMFRSIANSDPSANPRLLLTTDTDLVAAYRSLGRHAESARAMADVLADCHRVQPGQEEQRCRCAIIAADLVSELPRPAYTGQALVLAAGLSRACRGWLPRGDVGETLAATASDLLSRCLNEALGAGVAPDEWRAAALEVSAGVQLVADQRPSLLRPTHVRALASAAITLAAQGHMDDALAVNTRAIELGQELTTDESGLDPLVGVASLVQQGMLLSAKQRHKEAVRPLEQALPILLAAGPEISIPQAKLLASALDLLRKAYQALNRDAALQAMTDAFKASGVPPVIYENRPAGAASGDLTATLQAAEADATADPERPIAVFRELLRRPTDRGDYLIARSACARVITALNKAGRFPEALRLCDLLLTSDGSAGLGEWARLDGRCRKLNVQLDSGLDAQAVLADASALVARADELTAEPGDPDGADPAWIQESLLRVGARAALRVSQWPDALRFIQTEASSMHDRGAPLPEIALAEFNSYTALAATGRLAEVAELLDRCEAAFREDDSEQDLHLGLVAEARADLAANTGDLVRAVRLQSAALARLYRSRDVVQIQRGHAALSVRHTQADQHSPLALAHALAAAMIAELIGQGPDIEAITSAMSHRAGECPATPAALVAAVNETPQMGFADLVDNLSRSRAAPATGEVLASLLRQARDSQRDLFDELARHRAHWDPVFAGITAARRGEAAMAKGVTATLAAYDEDESWSQLCLALGHVFRQRPEAAAAMPLDAVDRLLLRRCTDVLGGVVRIPPELAYAMPVCSVLAEVLFAAQNGRSSSALARVLQELAEGSWRGLVRPIQKILAGDRGLDMTSGLNQVHTVIITKLLDSLSAPGLPPAASAIG